MRDGPHSDTLEAFHAAGVPDSTRMSSDDGGPSREPGTAGERDSYTGASQIDPQSARRWFPRQYRGSDNEFLRSSDV
jgi:hypothetical protein